MKNGILNLQKVIQEITGREDDFFTKDVRANSAELAEKINGASVLVIGGAGTIGLSFIKAILKCGTPASLCIVDINENGLTETIRDLRSTVGLNLPADIITYPLNFHDPLFVQIFNKRRPFDIIANFAAHKHVRSEKDVFAINGMLNNNVIYAYEFLKLAETCKPKHFFCVSTDKAANPVNIMGASKKLMEEVLFSFQDTMNVSTARFANVAFSNGSLPAGFLERLTKKQPFSAPSDILRYFVSPQEAGELCMLSCILGQSGDIFFPKLDPAKDLKSFTLIAEKLLNAIGLEPYLCQSEEEAKLMATTISEESSKYPVFYFNSDTTGEKAFEEFYTEEETIDWNRFENIGVVKSGENKTGKDIQAMISYLQETLQKEELKKDDLVKCMEKLLPSFKHEETGKLLDQRM